MLLRRGDVSEGVGVICVAIAREGNRTLGGGDRFLSSALSIQRVSEIVPGIGHERIGGQNLPVSLLRTVEPVRSKKRIRPSHLCRAVPGPARQKRFIGKLRVLWLIGAFEAGGPLEP